MVLTRAFACAAPVVASDIEGYREVLTPETSVAVPPGDVPALVEAVERLLADEPPRAALGVAARRLAEERYSWTDIAARLEAVYERVIAEPRREARAA
jgi:glycosyltransferase involved in cell wall biosynthesis